MGNKMGYIVDLHSLKFEDAADGNASSWIQAMPIGTYQHPMYGEIDITPDRVIRFADNVNNGARGQELDIDYDHKQHNGKAAGWVKSAEARLNESDPKKNGLWLLVEWVKDAYQNIKDGAYKYFSPEFEDSWTHPVSGQEFNDVLFGGGITNRPFLKGILPLNLSEVFAEVEQTHESKGMFTDEQRTELRTRYGLSDDADDAAIIEAVMKLLPVINNEGTPNQDELPTAQLPTAQLSEDEVKQLSENPTTRKLLSMLEANSKKFKEMEDAATVVKLDEKFRAKGLALPPTVKDALSDVIKLSENKKLTDAVVQFTTKLAEVGFVQLGEKGSSSGTRTDVDAFKKLDERAKVLMSEQKITYKDAIVIATREMPDAADAYRSDSYIKE